MGEWINDWRDECSVVSKMMAILSLLLSDPSACSRSFWILNITLQMAIMLFVCLLLHICLCRLRIKSTYETGVENINKTTYAFIIVLLWNHIALQTQSKVHIWFESIEFQSESAETMVGVDQWWNQKSIYFYMIKCNESHHEFIPFIFGNILSFFLIF